MDDVHPLEPADVLATGTTPRGLSAFQDGDQAEVDRQVRARALTSCVHLWALPPLAARAPQSVGHPHRRYHPRDTNGHGLVGLKTVWRGGTSRGGYSLDSLGLVAEIIRRALA